MSLSAALDKVPRPEGCNTADELVDYLESAPSLPDDLIPYVQDDDGARTLMLGAHSQIYSWPNPSLFHSVLSQATGWEGLGGELYAIGQETVQSVN